MLDIVKVTLKGIFRDRVFQGIFFSTALFPFIPAIASLSMRQVTELSITLSLSLISFMLLLLSVFLGGVSLWKDIDRRYAVSVLGLPISRNRYLVGRFFGNALFLVIAVVLLTLVSLVVIYFSSGIYPSGRPIVWGNFILATFFDLLKYVILISVAFLFSCVSTSFFLPIFGTIAIFLVGSASQEAFDFIQTPEGSKLPAVVTSAVRFLYYLLPNFSAFDLKVSAVYGLKPAMTPLLLTVAYFILYTSLVLLASCLIFSRREIK